VARQLRIEFAGALYHVTSRGNAREPTFQGDEDRERFLTVLQEVVLRFNWRCHAYCLMDNHYHALVETVEANLSEGMRHLNGVYTQRFNRAHDRAGHVFQGRYKSILVEKQAHLLELCRYVVLNPVRAGMTKDPGQYGWSSYRATAGLCKRPAFLTLDWVLGQFGPSRTEARRRYREFVRDGIDGPSPWGHLKARCILGGKAFIDRVKPALEERSHLSEIPRQDRFAFRPSLEDLFGELRGDDRARRNKQIAAAHLKFGYSLSEIARQVGLHYTTISNIVRQRL